MRSVHPRTWHRDNSVDTQTCNPCPAAFPGSDGAHAVQHLFKFADKARARRQSLGPRADAKANSKAKVPRHLRTYLSQVCVNSSGARCHESDPAQLERG